MKKSLFLILLVVIISAFGFFYLLILKDKNQGLEHQNSDSLTIEFTGDSYQPNQLVIKKGQTVLWINKSSQPIWPASNIHPTHQIYPEFDPKRPIKPQESWSFSFNKIGIWRYHDHLAPEKTGLVEVVE